MKIGRLQLRLADKLSVPTRQELGSTGTIFFAGQLSEEEYNSDLRGEKGRLVFDKMRRSDGQIKAALLACSLPLHTAFWDMSPGKGPHGDEIAEFVHHNLFEAMTITWSDFLRHVLLMYPFGFSLFEKVWELKDGKWRWRKLAPRLARTVYKWHADGTGGLAGVTQRTWKDDKYQLIEIPVEKLLLFNIEQEGSNFEGTSLLRAAYKPWYYKSNLERIDGIAAERHGVGIAVFKLPPSATTESGGDWDKISAIGERLIAHERSYVAVRNDYDFKLEGVSGQLHDIVRSIEYHDIQIVRSILAQFMNLGGEGGSYALSRDQSSFFLMALRAIGMGICDTINRHAIPQLVYLNWDVDEASLPKLTVSGLEVVEIDKWTSAVARIVEAGAVLPDLEMEQEVRRVLKLPHAARTTPPPGPPRAGQPTPEPEEPGSEEPPEEGSPQQQAERRYRLARAVRLGRTTHRELKDAERHVAFTEIEDRLTKAEGEFFLRAKKVQDRQIAKLVDVVAKLLQGGQVDKVAEVDVPYRAQMTEELSSVLTGLYDYGRAQVAGERGRQLQARGQAPGGLALVDPQDVERFLGARAASTSAVLGSKLKAALTWEALHQFKEDIINMDALAGKLTELSDRELTRTSKFSVNEAFAMGRNAEGAARAGEISRVIYSAIMDGGTCEACNALDGQEFTYQSAERARTEPPYSECDGLDRCRCVHVYVFEEERPGAA